MQNPNDDNEMTIRPRFQVVVLGDVGRSPRMQNHAISLAARGADVDLIGVIESRLHPQVEQNDNITPIAVHQVPACLRTTNRFLVLLLAPAMAIWQAFALFYAMVFATKPPDWILVQNPPSVPTFFIAIFVATLRGAKVAIDWHNFGYSLLALKLGASHPLVVLHKLYEFSVAKLAHVHFAVTSAMAEVLQRKITNTVHPLHDRPTAQFQPMDEAQRLRFRKSTDFLDCIPLASQDPLSTRLLVSSTSWTPDEDFSLLLDALVIYSTHWAKSPHDLPEIDAVITGKGPQKPHYVSQIKRLREQGKLTAVKLHTAWLSSPDYASLLASADLGVSLHTSSSGLDLPMKVVDMFGAGLPVVGVDTYKAWPELVHEGINGRGFSSAPELATLLIDLFNPNSTELARLRSNALQECSQNWSDEWDRVAGKVFSLR